MGYPNLYVLFRVLNEIKPKRILELGLGQSSKMVGQYVSAFEDTEHLIIEHDQDWINFFSRTFELPARSQIIRLEREMVPYKEADAVRVFKGFEKVVHGKIFDLILIDAPLGGDMKQYARIDVLEILPACLAEDFMILLDDYERIGEQHTVKEIEMALKDANIPYKRGKYSGKKDCIVIVSESLSFLTSM